MNRVPKIRNSSEKTRNVAPAARVNFGTNVKPFRIASDSMLRKVCGCKHWWLIILTRVAILAALSLTGKMAVGLSFDVVVICLLMTIALDLCIIFFPLLPWVSPESVHRDKACIIAIVSMACGLFAFAVTRNVAMTSAESVPQAAFAMAGILAIVAGIAYRDMSYLLAASLATAMAIALSIESPSVAIFTIFFFVLAIAAIRFRQADLNRETITKNKKLLESDRAEMLVSDYEKSGRGWFWLTDRHGKISYMSASVEQSLPGLEGSLIGRTLTELVAPSHNDENAAERTLSFHLTARSAFTDLVVKLAQGEEERFWSMSGTPFFNDLGQFVGFRGHGTDLTEVRRSQDAVTHLARYDNLTGLANRLYIKEIFEKALINHRHLPLPCAIFMIDLDRFKQVNDTLGHAAGDVLLKQVSERLTRTIGERGQVGRLGGDEFLVVLPGMMGEEKLAELAKLVIANLSHPYMVEGTQLVIGASVGVVLNEGKERIDAETNMRNADLALYSAKENGRGTYRFFHENMHDIAKQRSRLEEDLRHALATGGLSLAYQPVVNVASEQISGYEVLARWNHPTLGAISPGQFIPIAEEAGLISQLGEWVLRTACDDAVAWSKDVRVAVNVSPIQFADPGFPAIVVNTLARSGLSPDRLELEITENVFIDDRGNIDEIFKRLKGIGVRLALDDFGTGYSALGYLRKAPVNKIKIDQSFVRGAVDDLGTNRAIIKSIVVLAEALGMETTAEGAETLDELDLVRTLGCSHVQGYVYGKPMPAEEISDMLDALDGKAQPTGYQSTRAPRRKVLRTIGVVHSDYCYRAKIRNLSPKGALIEGLWDVPPLTQFKLILSDSWSIDAVTRWSDGDKMGVEFSETVELEKLRQLAPPNIIQGATAPETENSRMAS